MGEWYSWLVMAGTWIVVMLLRIFERRSNDIGILIGFYLFIALVCCALGIAQYFCEKKGDGGKKLLKKINIGAVILVIVVSVVLLLIV